VPYPIHTRLICMLFVVLSCIGLTKAQTHYSIPFPLPTSKNMVIVIPITPTINGIPVQSGDEIAVFDSIGQCCGFTKWKTISGNSITAWGDDPMTSEQDGFKDGEKLRFRIWDSSTVREAIAKARDSISTSVTSDSFFVSQGISMLASLAGTYSSVKAGSPAAHAGENFALTGDEITYTLSHSEPVQIALFDLRGRCILSLGRIEDTGKHRLSLRDRHLPEGCYVARFSAGVDKQELPVVIRF